MAETNETLLNNTGHPVFRTKPRLLLIFYDVLFYVFFVFFFFLFDGYDSLSFSTGLGWFNVGAGFVLMFFFRFLFHVYRYIVRYGNFAMFTHLVGADLCYGIVYLVGAWLMQPVPRPVNSRFFACSAILFGLNLVAAIVSRILYFSLFNAAVKHPKLRKPLQILTFVDFDSPDSAGTMQLSMRPVSASGAPINEVQNIVRQFAIRGEPVLIKQITKGYVNRTYYIEALSDQNHVHKYMLQRINQNAFHDVDALMNNFLVVTGHLHNRLILKEGDPRNPFQALRSTKDGRRYLRDDSGCWRMMVYIDECHTLDLFEHPEAFYHAGRAFGMFDRVTAQMDPASVSEIIPNFHNTKSRYADLEAALKADPVHRAKDVDDLVGIIRKNAGLFGIISDSLGSKDVPIRVCHNDCNLNNILFDDKTNLPVAIIDLDTVMPSSPLYDFGDSMRIGTNTAKDDERDMRKVSCDLDLFRSYACGFLETCGDILTHSELELLPLAAPIITFEDGIRFLTDHINGDTYYNIFYAGQNLDRARNQVRLATDMLDKMDDIIALMQTIYNDLQLDVDLSVVKQVIRKARL